MLKKKLIFKIFIVSNMYPSKEDKFYGIFVKNFVDGFKNTDVKIISKSIIYGRGRSIFQKMSKYILLYFSIIKNILKFNYDLIYIHYPIYSSLPIILFSPFIRKPIILNFHGTDVFAKSKFAKTLRFITKPLISKTHTIVVPSEYFKQVVSKKFNIALSKIFVSPSGGIDTNLFKKNNLQKEENKFVLGYVGRIDEGKGWDVFLKACAELKSVIPKLKCIIAGNGNQVTDLINLISELDIGSFVTFKGPILYSELPEFYGKLDLFIFPTTLNESLGLVGIEALSCGVPIIGSKIGGLENYIIDGVNGAFVENKSVNDLISKILFLHKNKGLLQKLKKGARKSIMKYNNKYVAKQMNRKIEEIIRNYEQI